MSKKRMANVQSGHHSFFFSVFPRTRYIHSFNTGNILYNLFSGNSSHSDCHSSNIYLFVRGFRSVINKGQNQKLVIFWPTDWLAQQQSQVTCISQDQKCWGAWSTTCWHKAKHITPSITRGEMCGKRKWLSIFLERTRGDNVRETSERWRGASACFFST